MVLCRTPTSLFPPGPRSTAAGVYVFVRVRVRSSLRTKESPACLLWLWSASFFIFCCVRRVFLHDCCKTPSDGHRPRVYNSLRKAQTRDHWISSRVSSSPTVSVPVSHAMKNCCRFNFTSKPQRTVHFVGQNQTRENMSNFLRVFSSFFFFVLTHTHHQIKRRSGTSSANNA